MTDIGIISSKHDPCLFYGITRDGTPPTTPRNPIHVGLCIENFVFFLYLDAEESCFKKLLNEKVTTNFMGDSDFFLESSFKWNWRPDGNLSVHVSQQGFSRNTTSRFGLKDYNYVSLMTPYRTDCPIDSIPNPDPDKPDLPKCNAVYQYICASIN